MKKILVICGPTASGKTKLSIECAKLLNTEIIYADSMAIYRHMDVGTAKPTIEERQGITHHMIDIIQPTQSFSVSEYKKIAVTIINKLFSKGKTPIICGGTGLYIKSILYDSSFGNIGSSEKIRNYYSEILKNQGIDFLYDKLKQCDYESSLKIHKNDTKRVIRALEIFELTGNKKSQANDTDLLYEYNAVMYNYERKDLYNRINLRVDNMLESGLVEEVKKLGISEEYQSMQGIGYKEVLQYLKNEINHSTMRDIIAKNSRNYAKRQLTYFNKFNNMTLLNPREDVNKVAKDVIASL